MFLSEALFGSIGHLWCILETEGCFIELTVGNCRDAVESAGDVQVALRGWSAVTEGHKFSI